MQPLHSCRGQASTEYVGVLGLVAALLAAAAVLVPGTGIAGAVVRGVERALCLVTGSSCDAVRRAEACSVATSVVRRKGKVALVIPRYELGKTLKVERFSDGHVEVSLSTSDKLAAGLGLGVLRGPERERLAGDLQLGYQFTSGRTWSFRDLAEARRFVRAWRQEQDVLQTVGDRLGLHDRPELPPAAIEWSEHAAVGDALAGFGLRAAGGEAVFEGAMGIGMRTDRRSGERAVYLRLDRRLAGALHLTASTWPGFAGAEGVLELTADRSGQPVRMRVLLAGAAGAGRGSQIKRVGHKAHDVTGVEAEARATLDLRDPAHVDAVRRALRAGVVNGAAGLGALARYVWQHGRITLATYDTGESERADGLMLGRGLVVGVGWKRTSGDRELRSIEVREDGVSIGASGCAGPAG